LNGNKITEVVWSRRLKEFICDRDNFVFYAIWYLEPVECFRIWLASEDLGTATTARASEF